MHKQIRLQLSVLVIGIILMAIKFIAYWLTGSNSILTDAAESIINVTAGAFTLYSIYLSNQPKDKNHPYGHGKIEYISSGIEGGLIFSAGIIMIVKAGYNFLNPQTLTALDFGIYLTTAAGIINYFAGAVLVKNGNKYESPAMIAGGKHLKTDAYSSAAMIMGLVIILLTNIFWLDNVIAILFSILICKSGLGILKNSVSGIMDEADYSLLSRIIKVFNDNRDHSWIDIHNLRAIKYGSMLHVDCHLTLPWYFTVRDAHKEIEHLEELIDAEMSKKVEMFIHSDECSTFQCKICKKTECNERSSDFEKQIDWSLENVIINQKHNINSL
jgi:cation diffusion facilitator family transporter